MRIFVKANESPHSKDDSAPSIYDRYDEDNPDEVGVTTAHSTLGKSTEYTFPHASVVVLLFHRLQTP